MSDVAAKAMADEAHAANEQGDPDVARALFHTFSGLMTSINQTEAGVCSYVPAHSTWQTCA